MPEQFTLVERFGRPAAAIAAVAALSITGCSRQSGGQPGSVATPSVSHSAFPAPGANKAPADMADAQDSQLRILAGYESALHHNFDHEMYFTDMPRSVEEAESQADDMANTLKEYSKYGIKPLIVMEPTDNDGGNIPLDKLHQPDYTHVLDSLFRGLKERGITDEEMGTLFPMPEADLPSWGKKPYSTNPELFGQNYTAIGTAYRRVFPGSKLGLLLDSTAYHTGDEHFEHGDTSSAGLMPYVEALKGTPDAPKVNSLKIDSLMFQGFPFVAGTTPQDWLNGGVAVSLAERLGVRTIWFNTGTARYIDGHNVSTDIRSALLSGELKQAEAAKAAGFITKINVFAGEDHDPTILWNYPIRHGEVAQPLPTFIRTVQAAGIETALFADQK